jgi:hypothetical protein
MLSAFNNSPVGGASNFGPHMIPVVNVTAAALTQYGVYALDISKSDSDVDSIDKALSSVIAVATASMAAGGILVVVQSAIGAAKQGNAVVFGHTYAKVDGTTNVAEMEPLKGVNAAIHLVKATAATDRFHAIMLEDYTTDAVATKEVIFDGIGRF